MNYGIKKRPINVAMGSNLTSDFMHKMTLHSPTQHPPPQHPQQFYIFH